MDLEVSLLRTSFEAIKPNGHQFTHTFYSTLFSRSPEVRALCKTVNMAEQFTKFLRALTLAIRNLEKPAFLKNHLENIGKEQAALGAKPEFYEIAGRCLIEALKSVVGERWNDNLTAAWEKAYRFAITVMLGGGVATATATSSA